MTPNLLKNTNKIVTKPLLIKASVFLDEMDIDIKETIGLIIPLVFSSFIHFNNKRHAVFVELFEKYGIRKEENRDLKGLFSGDNSLLLDKNYHFLSKFLNTEAVNNVKELVASYTDVHQESVMTLLKMLITPILIALDDAIENNNIPQDEILNLLNSQKIFIDKKVSADFMNRMIDDVGFHTLQSNASFYVENESSSNTLTKSKFISIGLGFLTLALSLGLIYLLLNKENLDSKNITIDKNLIEQNTIDSIDLYYKPTNFALGKYVKTYENLGYFQIRKLKNGTSIYTLSKGGLNNFLDYIEENRPINKTAWFDLDRVVVVNKEDFDMEKSTSEINNLIEILNSYPNLSIKIGALTDNIGPADVNFNKSHKLAEKFMRLLIKKGISSYRLRYEGYGENYPIKNNDSKEKILNNRIAIRLAGK